MVPYRTLRANLNKKFLISESMSPQYRWVIKVSGLLFHDVAVIFHWSLLFIQICPQRWFTLYLVIWMSQKNRLFEGDFEGKFQTSIQASITNFLIWKNRSIVLIFLLFFVGDVKSTAFRTHLVLFKNGWNESNFCIKLQFEYVIGIAATVC